MPNEKFMDAAEKIENNVNRIIKNSKFEVVTKKLEKISLENKNKERFVFERPPLLRWVIPLLLSVAFTVVFLYFFAIFIGTFFYSSSHRIYGIYGMSIIAVIVMVNILVSRKTIKEIRFSKRYDDYQNVLRYRSIGIVDDLAEMIEVDRKIVEKDLTKAIKNNLIPQGHFGRDNVIFMVSDAVFDKYSKRKAIYDRYFRKLLEERNRMKEHSKEIEELLEQGEEFIGKIRDSSDLIKDKEVTKKLDRMEKVVSAIFHEVDMNPAQANKLGVFMSYYLPTTEKLLEAYIDLDEKKVKGKSSQKTQKDIANALDSINNAFEGLLERFFQEQERDITSEIFAMEAIMKQEGLRTEGE